MASGRMVQGKKAVRRRNETAQDILRRHQAMADATERSVTQWAVLSALAFAERAGVVICSLLFLADGARDFWSAAGVGFVLLHLLFMSPVYGIGIFLTERAAYRGRKALKKPVLTMEALKKLGRCVHFFWFWPMLAASKAGFDLYYSLFSGLKWPFGG